MGRKEQPAGNGDIGGAPAINNGGGPLGNDGKLVAIQSNTMDTPPSDQGASRLEIPADHYATPMANMLTVEALFKGELNKARVQQTQALLVTADVQ
jgi:hypothetical protein